MAVSHSYFQRDGLAATGYIDDYAYAKAAKQSSKARPEFAYSRSANPFLAPPPSLKACTQCGTTRTPQWREGPEGPKTLCNACGVKRVRAMRLATGEAPPKRRNSGDRSMAHTLPPKTLAALSLGKQSSGSLTSDSIGRKRVRSPSASGRPQRKAAAKAASRTAEFATTGDWPDEEEAMYPNSPLERSLSPSASDDSAALNSDSAEEVAWTPTRGPAYHPAVPLPPSPMPMVGHETAAAVNLLSMSIREADLAASRAAAAGAHAHRSTPPALTTEQLQQMAARSPCNLSSPGFAAMLSAAVNSSAAAVREDDQHSAEQAREALQDTLRSLPATKQIDMRVLKEAYDSSLREAAAADAAVAAVAKILAIKQAAAIKARAGASVAANAMHSWMIALDEEYSWTRASRPKHERS